MAKLTVPIVVDMDDILKELEKYDFVEVVRCKDCKYDHSRDCVVRLCGFVSGEFFCSMGERRE